MRLAGGPGTDRSKAGLDHQGGDTDATSTAAEPVVDVADVSVTLGETPVLDGVSLSVARGEFVGLVGPNGAGKTTLLRTIRGTLAPDSGHVMVAGDDVHALSSRAASRRVASVPQETALSFEFSVREAVEMGRTPHLSRFGRMSEADREAVTSAMERTEVSAFADRPVTAVSGGERSRVLLARALAQDTPVLLLDEPTASLDVNHQVRTLDLVADLTDEGRTAVAAIHDLDLAARYCDRLVVVADGRVLADGPPATVLSTDTLRAAFDADAVVMRDPVTDSPRVTTRSRRTRDAHEGEGVPEEMNRVHVVAGGGRAGRLLARLDDAGLSVSVGPVAGGDTDTEVATALGMETLQVDPLAGVDTGTRERLAGLLADVDAVVVADVALTGGLLPVFREVERAGTPVVCVAARPLPERAREQAVLDAYVRLEARGQVVEGASVLSALGRIGSRSAGLDDVQPGTPHPSSE